MPASPPALHLSSADAVPTMRTGTKSRWFDAAGNATPLVSGDGATTRMFDQLDRLIGIDYSDATPDVTLGYDGNGNRSSMSDGAGTETYTYDALDRMRTVTHGSDVYFASTMTSSIHCILRYRPTSMAQFG